jgi:Zn-finger nucleic acid-binding protein
VRPNGSATRHRKRIGETCMTIQQKRMIELSDILAFQLICKECGVSLSIPVSSNLKNERPSKCPSCDEVWMTPVTGSIRKLLDLKEVLISLKSSIGNGSADRFNLMIEISSDPVSTAKD